VVGAVSAGARDVIGDVTAPPTGQCSVCYGRQPTDWRCCHRCIRPRAHDRNNFRMLSCLQLVTTTGTHKLSSQIGSLRKLGCAQRAHTSTKAKILSKCYPGFEAGFDPDVYPIAPEVDSFCGRRQSFRQVL